MPCQSETTPSRCAILLRLEMADLQGSQDELSRRSRH